MLDVTLTVRLGLVGPVLSHATAIGTIGIDAPMARDRTDTYYLPFSLIRGRLRQAWQELDEATDGQIMVHQGQPPHINDLLGVGSDQPDAADATDFEPKRGRLRFTDFSCEGTAQEPGILFRIRMDADRGAADEGAMQVIECPFAPGQRIIFKGTIRYLAQDESEADSIQSYITYGLRWITSLGGERTTGFGRLVHVEIEAQHQQVQIVPRMNTATTVDLWHIAVTPQAPFCVSKRPVVQNLFESETILSGGVLRGTLATTLKQLANLPRERIIDSTISPPWQELGTYFNHLRFTHLFPAADQSGQRPVARPLSLVKDDNNTVYDVVLCDGPILLGNPRRAPSFAVDWKDASDVERMFGWPKLERELRVRTAMDRQRRRAQDEQLFAYDMIVPDGHVWYGTVDLSRIPQAARTAVADQLRTLLEHGLQGMGKTKATANVQVDVALTPAYASDANPLDNLWVITLQTPMLLCDPTVLNETSGTDELFAAYDTTWQDLSDGAVKLVRFFASQSLAGGYQVVRFQANKPYNPFLLTDAGSVFVLEAVHEQASAQAFVNAVLRHGLPLPGWAKTRYGDDWRTCPFLPEDGFGEVAVNLPCHTSHKPGQEVSYAI